MKKKNFLNNIPFLHKLLGTDPNQPSEMQPAEVLAYSTAGFGQNMICQLVTSFFLFFLTDAVGLNPIWLAVMFLCARLFDAFNDPIMGTIVDRTRSKRGKMRPYLLFMPVPIVILTILLFVRLPGVTDAAANMAWATTIYILWGVCYTTVDVPYWGLASSMTCDTEKRNSMLTIARLICMAGAGIVTVIIPLFQDMCRGNVMANIGIDVKAFDSFDQAFASIDNVVTQQLVRDNLAEQYQVLFLIVAIIVAILALPTFFIGYKFTKERYYEDGAQKASLKHNLKLLVKNKPILLLIATGVLGSLRLIYMTSGLYYAKYNLGSEAIFSTLTLLVIPGGLIASVTTPWLSKKFGKRNVFIASHLVGGIAMVGLYFVGMGSFGTSQASTILFYIVLVLLGVPSGFSNILQYSMIADTIDYLEDKTGERAEGICFSVQTFISKIGMALTAFVCLLILGVEGYSGAGNVAVEDNVKSGIWMMTTLLSGLSTVLCVVPLFFYRFTEKKQAEAVARVAARKKAALEAEGIFEDEANTDDIAHADGIATTIVAGEAQGEVFAEMEHLVKKTSKKDKTTKSEDAIAYDESITAVGEAESVESVDDNNVPTDSKE